MSHHARLEKRIMHSVHLEVVLKLQPTENPAATAQKFLVGAIQTQLTKSEFKIGPVYSYDVYGAEVI